MSHIENIGHHSGSSVKMQIEGEIKPLQSGDKPSLSDVEIKEYLVEVAKELKKPR
jgi:hypothetical protein